MLFPQLLALPRRSFLQGPGGQALSRSVGHFFHLRQIDIQARPYFAKSLSHDNFSPLFGEPGDSLQFFGRELPCGHDIAILDVREIRQGEFHSAYPTLLSLSRKVRPALSSGADGSSALPDGPYSA